MQNIARLAGPVVHGFKRGSKLLGWWVALVDFMVAVAPYFR
jgi:hypothetical protein